MLESKYILVTGCSSGIGYAAAKRLKQAGYQVIAGVRKAEDKARLEAEGLYSLILDLNDSQTIKAAVDAVLSVTNGQLFGLVNNAGFGQPGAVEDLTREALRTQFETNVFGPLELTNLVIPIMRKQGYGRIINISSILGLVSMAYRGAYCASKYAVEALTDCLRLELKDSGIKVSLIEPGPIATSFRDRARTAYEANIQTKPSVHQPFYNNMLSNIEQIKDTSRFTLPPEAVVGKIMHALESRHPKIRYYVTVPAYVMAGLKRILPNRSLDHLLTYLSKHLFK